MKLPINVLWRSPFGTSRYTLTASSIDGFVDGEWSPREDDDFDQERAREIGTTFKACNTVDDIKNFIVSGIITVI